MLDLIRSFLKENDLLLDIAEIERLLFEKQFLLLVDGLNELLSEEARRDLMAFRRENAATLMIFTRRDLGVRGDLAIAKKLEMQLLTDSQMRDFLKRYLLEQGEQMWHLGPTNLPSILAAAKTQRSLKTRWMATRSGIKPVTILRN